jgi:hypothetical protein
MVVPLLVLETGTEPSTYPSSVTVFMKEQEKAEKRKNGTNPSFS